MSVVQAQSHSQPQSQQSVDRHKTVVYTAAYAGLVGAASVAFYAGDAFAGDVPGITRVLIGLLGIGAAALLWTRPRQGWLLALVWAVVQIPFVAWNVDGNALGQIVSFPLTVSSSTTVNGEITSFSEYGLNIVGIILVVVINRWRAAWEYRNR